MIDEPLRVLLVDDDQSLRDPLAEFLQATYNYQVKPAADAESAIKLVKEAAHPFHVALIDDLLTPSPGSNPKPMGASLMIQIKAFSQRTEVIIFTGWGLEGALEALQAGAFRYLAKPFNYEELAILIRHAAEQHRLIKERDTLKLLSAISDKLNFSHLDLDDLLKQTISLTVKGIGAYEGSLLVVDENGILQSWRSVGTEMSDQKAQLILADGCARWVMDHCQSACIDDFCNDKRWRLLPNDALKQGSALVVPLKYEDKAIGVLSFTAVENCFFKEEHILLVESIASQAAIAIQHAALFRKREELAQKLKVEQEKLRRFISCSPNGLIVVDRQGIINFINEQAQHILGYTEGELIGKDVHILYHDEAEPRRIGALLANDSEHIVRAEKTVLETKDKRPIHVLLSVAYWNDQNNIRLGSIGYFENLTEIQKKDNQLVILSKASEIMALADTIKGGLDELAVLLVKQLNRSFCNILLYKENESTLQGNVFYVDPKVMERRNELMSSGCNFTISDFPLLKEIFDENCCKVLSRDLPRHLGVLDRIAGHLQLSEQIQSLLLVPMKKEEKIVGLLIIGEIHEGLSYQFTQEEEELATAIAFQITGLIDRRMQHDIADYRSTLMEKLSKLSVHSSQPIPKFEQKINQIAFDVLGYSMSFLFAYNSRQKTLAPCQCIPENTSLPPILPLHEKYVLSEAVITGQPQFHTSYDKLAGSNNFLNQFNLKTIIAFPLKTVDKVDYVLVLGDYNDKPFIKTDVEVLEWLASRVMFSIQSASVALQNNIIHLVNFYLQRLLSDKEVIESERLSHMLHAILTGVTAGYGLGFNRAAIFLLDDSAEYLVCKCGIGHIIRDTADAAWRGALIEDFSQYIEQYKQGKIEKTPLGKIIEGMRLECGPGVDNVFREVIEGKYPEGVVLEGKQIKKLPGIVIEKFNPESQVAITPLIVRGQVIGVLIADNRFTHSPINDEDLKSLLTYVNVAAVTLENHQLIKSTEQARNTAKSAARFTALGDLDSTLETIVNGTRDTTGCEPIVLFVYDQKSNIFRRVPTMIGVRNEAKVYKEQVPENSIVYEIMNKGELVVANDVFSHPMFKDTRFAREEGVKSCLAVPLLLGDESVGVMFVNSRSSHSFTKNELTNIDLFASQAAVAISNARLYDVLQKRIKALETLHEAGAEITETLDEREVVEKILRQVWKLSGKDNSFASVRQIVDGEAVLVAHYPDPPPNDRIQISPGEGRPIGIIGRAVLDKKPQLYGDVSLCPDYLKYYPSTKAELAVPIIIDDKVDYVINLEHPELFAFDDGDKRAVSTLATQATIAIQNARKYNSLMEAREQVKSSMALTWMSMASGLWRHEITGKAITIDIEVGEILDSPHHEGLTKEQKKRLMKIRSLANKIINYKITPPISNEEGVTSVSVNDFLTERFRALSENDPDSKVKYNLNLCQDDPLEIWISSDWLRVACDIVVDNAIRAVKHMTNKEISVTTSLINEKIRIVFEDTGEGIPEKVRSMLFKGIISKEDGGLGLGAGLLTAKLIIKKYGGEIWIPNKSTEDEVTGTRVVIEFPQIN